MHRARSPVPSYGAEFEKPMINSENKDENAESMHMPTYGTENKLGNVSPATKSLISERSWIDNKEVVHSRTQENAQIIIEKLTKVINHLQNELSKNAITISQLIEENRQFQSRADSSNYGQ